MQLFAITALSIAAHFAPTMSAAPVTSAPDTEQTFDQQSRAKAISAGHSHRWTINQRAGRLAAIAVVPGRARGLEIYLFDGDGKLVASDTDVSDGLGFGVREGWKGPFTLVVKNMSRQDNLYQLLVE